MRLEGSLKKITMNAVKSCLRETQLLHKDSCYGTLVKINTSPRTVENSLEKLLLAAN